MGSTVGQVLLALALVAALTIIVGLGARMLRDHAERSIDQQIDEMRDRLRD